MEDRQNETPQAPVVVLVNAGSGTVRARRGQALRDEIAALFEERGVRASVALVRSRDIGAAADRAVADFGRGDARAVVIGGGDGSVRAVVGAAAGSGLPLGVLPLGTLNHFARDLGLPLDLGGAVDVIARGHTRVVDVAEVNGRVFVNNSSIGIYPLMVRDRDRRVRRGGWKKWTAMMVASARALWRFPLRRLSICVAGRVEPYRTPCLFVGNNEYRLSLGAFGTRERLDTGALWLGVARTQSRASLLWLGLRSAIGVIDSARDLQAVKADSAEIRARTRRLLVAMDGEVEAMRPPLMYRVRPGALTVFAPPQEG
jgi:diacylglycerol kinase family enzyme